MLPEFLARPRIGGIRIIDWLILVAGLPLLYRLLGLVGPLFNPLIALCRRLLGKSQGPKLPQVHGSIRLLLLAAGIRWFVLTIDLPLVERQLYAVIRVAFLICGTVWLLLLLNDFGERYVRRRINVSHLGESIALLRLARRVGDVLIICLGGIAALAYLGIDATAALAGLGIGGIAVALAAQKTLENVIGGFSLVFDKAVRVGDFLKLGEVFGTVDRVGLRSTRIRTLDRTILSVPNGQIATANIETISDRDKFWFRHVIGVTYGTTPEQIRTIVSRVRELLLGRSGVEIDTVRARFYQGRALVSRHRDRLLHLRARLARLPRDPGGAAAPHHGDRRRGWDRRSPSRRKRVYLADDRGHAQVPDALGAEADLRSSNLTMRDWPVPHLQTVRATWPMRSADACARRIHSRSWRSRCSAPTSLANR